VRRANGLSVLKDLAGSNQDLVFLDPPFDAGLFDKAIAAAIAALGPQGLLYVEAPAAWSASPGRREGAGCSATPGPARCTRTCWGLAAPGP
jgi:16S rRNA (guanine966-N2)-methyltransferase